MFITVCIIEPIHDIMLVVAPPVCTQVADPAKSIAGPRQSKIPSSQFRKETFWRMLIWGVAHCMSLDQNVRMPGGLREFGTCKFWSLRILDFADLYAIPVYQ